MNQPANYTTLKFLNFYVLIVIKLQNNIHVLFYLILSISLFVYLLTEGTALTQDLCLLGRRYITRLCLQIFTIK